MFKHILAPLDGSPLAECVLPHIIAIARTFDARTTLLEVLSRSETPGQIVDPLGWQMGKAQAQNYLETINKYLRSAGLYSNAELIDGQAANSIIEFAHRSQVGLIMLSSHGHSGLSIWNVSGVVHKIIQKASLPVMIVRAYQPFNKSVGDLRYRTILVPLDSSQRAECALPAAIQLARYHQARLLAAHVVALPEMPRRTGPTKQEIALVDQLTEHNRAEATKYLQQIGKRLSSKDINIDTRLLIRKNVASALHELVEQEKADLVVMSAHGYSGETHWPYGNVVEKFIAYGTTPLLIYQDFQPGELKGTYVENLLTQSEGH
jgi:nucleotide-binding universal stress UspA family protein